MFSLYKNIEKKRTYIIAEMSANHGGTIANALKIVREVAAVGADCLKIQTYTADSLTIDCDNEYFKIKGGLWDGYKLYDLYKEAGTPYEWQAEIKAECERCGIDFLSTPFDKDGVDFLESLDVEAYKIASFELVDIPLIEYAAAKGKPMIMSTGMASIEEIQEDMHLGNIPDMARRFNLPIGLSDHSAGSLGAVVGVTLGACVIEKHVMLQGVESADSKFSMPMDEFAKMVQDVRNAGMIAQGPCYELTEGEKASKTFRRSIFVKKKIKAGQPFTEENICVIRPGYGLEPRFFKDIIGKTSCCDIEAGTPLTEKMIGD